MRKLKVALFTVFLLFIASTAVYSHTLEIDNNIGTTIHIRPDDNPIAGEESELIFEFKDSTGKFKPSDCVCVASIIQDNEIIFTKELDVSGNSKLAYANMLYTFPEIGIYQIKINGASDGGEDYNKFEAEFSTKIERHTRNIVNRSELLLPIVTVFVAILTVASIAFIYIKNKKNKK